MEAHIEVLHKRLNERIPSAVTRFHLSFVLNLF